jgi:hypothetical protein
VKRTSAFAARLAAERRARCMLEGNAATTDLTMIPDFSIVHAHALNFWLPLMVHGRVIGAPDRLNAVSICSQSLPWWRWLVE